MTKTKSMNKQVTWKIVLTCLRWVRLIISMTVLIILLWDFFILNQHRGWYFYVLAFEAIMSMVEDYLRYKLMIPLKDQEYLTAEKLKKRLANSLMRAILLFGMSYNRFIP